jgi:O-antigen/teichoic acid export membrane protein
METGLFRFSTKEGEDATTVYSTTLTFVGSLSLLFVGCVLLFLNPLCSVLSYDSHPEFVVIMTLVVAMDAFQCIPFARLRQQKRAFRFVSIKFLFIIPNILLNLFFFVGCPYLMAHAPGTVDWFYDPAYGAGYAFVANLICTSLQMVALLPELCGFRYRFDKQLLRRMLAYCFPLLILGMAGILNQTVDKLLFSVIFPDKQMADVQLGFYGAAVKIAMLLAMLTQAFRYAYEPFVFNVAAEKDDKRATYGQAMTYFVIFGLAAFLCVICYLDVLKYIISNTYWEGLRVVPIVMAAELFMGIYFNLSFWYKLSNQTRWGAYISIAGCALIIALNILLVPRYGYMACAWAGLVGYAFVTLLSYFIGQRKYPIPYDLRRITRYVLLAIALYVAAEALTIPMLWLSLVYKTFLLIIYALYAYRDIGVQLFRR